VPEELPERQFNIQTTPEIMMGVYSNFANVSHSDYEFTITFARVDHEVEEGEVPGVVVSRVNLSPRFMRELMDAMQDNFSKWQTREGIRDLPEFRVTASPRSRRANASAAALELERVADPLDRGRVGAEEVDEPSRRIGVDEIARR